MNLSRLRQELSEANRLYQAQLRVVMSHKGMMSGSVYLLRRKCGKEGCRCRRGELHESWVHQCRENGVQRTRMVPKGMRSRWRALTDEYRRFRLARREMTRLSARMLELADLIGRARDARDDIVKG